MSKIFNGMFYKDINVKVARLTFRLIVLSVNEDRSFSLRIRFCNYNKFLCLVFVVKTLHTHVKNKQKKRVCIINAKFHIRERRYHQCSKPPNFKSANAATNLTFGLGGYYYWRLWILAGMALVVLKFGVCGCCPKKTLFTLSIESHRKECVS